MLHSIIFYFLFLKKHLCIFQYQNVSFNVSAIWNPVAKIDEIEPIQIFDCLTLNMIIE